MRYKGVLLGNCQVGPLVSALNLFCPEINWQKINVNSILKVGEEDKFTSELEDADFILTQPLGPNFGAFSSEKLVERFQDRLVLFPNVFFRGRHPDMAYFGERGKRLKSPVGDYHSLVVLLAFIRGISKQKLNDEFEHYLAHFIDVIRIKDSSEKELITRCKEIDFNYNELIQHLNSKELSMLTFNHPDNSTITLLASGIVTKMKFGTSNSTFWVETNLFNALKKDVAWPIHRHVAAEYGLEKYESKFYRSELGRVIDQYTFIEESFAIYDRLETTQLKNFEEQALKWAMR